jgi:hypothetical protein
MSTPARFPNGINNVRPTDPLANFGMLDPTKWHVWFDDFDNFEADQWVITRVGTTPTEATISGDGGLLLLTMAATDDSSSSLQWSGDDNAAVVETFRFASGKKLFFKTRFQVSDATQSDFVLGLQITDTTPLAVSDGVYFRKDDGDTNLDFVVIKDSVATTATAFSTIANATFVELAFFYDGKSEFQVFKDGIKRASTVLTNLPNDEELAVSIHMQNGEAVAKTMTLDYIFVAKER